jgi:hypothetical protein
MPKVCDDPSVGDRRRLPWFLALPLMVAGSFAAHELGVLVFASRRAAPVDADGGVELAYRVDHGSITILPLVAGAAIALFLVWLAVRGRQAVSGRGAGDVSPLWFLALPPLGFGVQELAERLLHAEAIPFNPAHEPAFLAGLLLQLPFGLLAYFMGRLLLGLGAKIARILARARGFLVGFCPSTGLRPVRTIRLRIPVLALGHSVRGPPW